MISKRATTKFSFNKFAPILICWLALLLPAVALGEKMPLKHLTTADGLANNRVTRIYQDKKGFIWFATWEGLSRFDGYNFVNYGVRDGLANQVINDVSEDKQGRIWVAANDNGISLLVDKTIANNDAGNSNSKKFTSFRVGSSYHSNKVNRILIDSKDNLWCLTDDGLYRASLSENPNFSLVKSYPKPLQDFGSRALFEDNLGNVWFGIYHELFEARGDEVINHGAVFGYESDMISNVIQDKQGRIIVLSWKNGLFEFIPSSSQWRRLSSDLRKVSYFSVLIEDDENSLWFGGGGGLLKLDNGKITKYSVEQGLNGSSLLSLLQDREGNLWIGDVSSGINKISDRAIVSYPLAAGATPQQRQSIIENIVQPAEPFGNKFIPPGFTVSYKQKKWWISHNIIDESPLQNSVLRLRNGKEIDAAKFFDKPFKENDSISFYDAENGFLWFSKSDGFIYRMNAAVLRKDSIEKFRCDILANHSVDFMINDRRGGLWLFRRGMKTGRLRDGKCESFPTESEVPDLGARSVFLDSRGWLWIGTRSDGVAVTKNPEAETPTFKFYTDDDGLLSATIWSIAEDNNGRIYLGTGRGLNRFDPQTGLWQSFTTKDGLTGDLIDRMFKDSNGSIWIVTQAGLSKFNPDIERKTVSAPPIYISRINVAGENLPLPETGFVETSAIELASTRNNLTIDFVGLQFKGENVLSYQHKLEGIDEEWSKPDKNRTITFANLASGNYRFLVRAVNQEGLTSVPPAVFQFRILSPIYLRWWFLTLAGLITGAIVYAFYRLKVQKLLEVERTRTLIATDLHDDIGSDLSKISVLSEVVRMQLAGENESNNRLLSSIAEISRQSIASMSDIVWAIDPQRDSALEMIRKMREYAEEIFVPKGISVKFVEPETGAKIKLRMDLRRDIYLIFKEAINNVAKHSGGTAVKIIFAVKNNEIILKIEDNGCGFDTSRETSGNGLINMQNRAGKLKGKFVCESRAGDGTFIEIHFPQN